MAKVQSFSTDKNPTSSTISVTLSGVTANNLLVAVVSLWQNSATAISTPSGWALIEKAEGFNTGGLTARDGAMFYKVADGTETDITVTWTGSCRSSAIVTEYSGADATSPFEDSGEGPNTIISSGDPLNAGSATPVTADGQAVAAIGAATGFIGDSKLGVTDGFTIDHEQQGVGGTRPATAMASRTYSATTARSPDFTTIQSGDWAGFAAVAVFKDTGGGSTSVTANDITQSQTIDNVTLTQANVLAVNSMAHGQTIDQATLDATVKHYIAGFDPGADNRQCGFNAGKYCIC
jgi:hypothetical protein